MDYKVIYIMLFIIYTKGIFTPLTTYNGIFVILNYFGKECFFLPLC